jgi:hypothetical protein
MAELKTKLTDVSVEDFLNTIEDEQKRADCFEIVKIMKQAAKAEPKMWGPSIIGFGNYRYKSANGKENDWMLTGFSPRKQNITLYLMMGGIEGHGDLLKKLGKHKTGGGCLYINKLKDVDIKVLKELVSESVQMRKKSNK